MCVHAAIHECKPTASQETRAWRGKAESGGRKKRVGVERRTEGRRTRRREKRLARGCVAAWRTVKEMRTWHKGKRDQ
jgi:hypothetical protein